MVSRKVFKSTIFSIQEMKIREDKITEVFSSEFEDRSLTKWINFLRDVMEDESDWIGYFIYELDFGKNYKEGDITERDADGREVIVPMGTVDELYDVLVGNIVAKETNSLIREVSEIIEEEIPNFIVPRVKYYQSKEGVVPSALEACSLRIIEKIKNTGDKQ